MAEHPSTTPPPALARELARREAAADADTAFKEHVSEELLEDARRAVESVRPHAANLELAAEWNAKEARSMRRAISDMNFRSVRPPAPSLPDAESSSDD